MVELHCPMCDGAVLVAFEEAQLRCEECAITVEIDAARVVRPMVLPAAA